MEKESFAKKLGAWALIALVSAVWFMVGTQYGYMSRDSNMYQRGYQEGQKMIYDVAMIRIRAMEKEIDRLKGRN